MAAHAVTRLSAPRSVGRRFGLELGVAGALVGAVFWRRHHPALGGLLLTIGVTLLIAAMRRPSMLEPVARRWLAVGAVMARVTSPLLLTLLYFVLITPMGLLRRTLGRSPLRRDAAASSYWIRRPARARKVKRARMERQF